MKGLLFKNKSTQIASTFFVHLLEKSIIIKLDYFNEANYLVLFIIFFNLSVVEFYDG